MRTKTGFTELTPDALRWTCCPDFVPVDSSAEARACEEIIGQERALRAIQTGLDIKSLGYNIFITGMVGTGRTTTVKQLLDQLEKGDKTPDDILYVNNFKYPDEPVLILLPAGQGKDFGEAMAKLIDMLKTNVPQLLKSPYYTDKRDALVESQQKKQRDLLQALRGGGGRAGLFRHPGPDGPVQPSRPHPRPRGRSPSPSPRSRAWSRKRRSPRRRWIPSARSTRS